MDNNGLGPSSTSGADDNIVTLSSNIIVGEPDSIPNVDPFTQGSTDSTRINQQSVVPNAMKNRLLGSLISSSASGLGNGSILKYVIPGGGTANFEFEIADVQGRTIVAVPDIAVYIGSISGSTQWPFGPFGPITFPVSCFNNWGLTNNVNSFTSVVVANQFSDAQQLYVVCRWRIVTNPTINLAQATVISSAPLIQPSGAQYGGAGGG